MSAAVAATLCGLALGVLSRTIDTASWAPVWAGNMLAPWLVASWLAGATSTDARSGALRGMAVLAGVTAGYLLMAGPDAARLAPALAALALVAGPPVGAVAASWRQRSQWSVAGAAVLGALLLADGVLLQLGPRSTLDRLAFAVEVAAGPALALRLYGWSAAALAVPIAAGMLALELGALAVFGLALV